MYKGEPAGGIFNASEKSPVLYANPKSPILIPFFEMNIFDDFKSL